jgi:uncharacterized protein YqjF (DUF2071 family)
MHQQWLELAFLHWRVEPARVSPLLPPGTVPDLHDGSSWVGLIAFQMSRAGVGRGPAIPWLGTFPETNVRLYSVDAAGRRGVVFRSLEATRSGVVLGARGAFGVPYMWSRMRIRHLGQDVEYTSARRWPGPRGVGGLIRIRTGPPLSAGPNSLAHFVTARWGLHTSWLGRTLYVPNRHGPWPLHQAELVGLEDTLVAAAGLPGIVERPPDSVLWSPGVETVFAQPYDARRPLDVTDDD